MVSAVQFVIILGLAVNVFCQEEEALKARIGSTIEFPLNYTLSEGERFISLVWKHDADDIVIVGAGNVEIYKDSYQDRALVQKENYFLTLTDLTFSDSGRYMATLLTDKRSNTEETLLEVLASPDVSARAVAVLDDGAGTERVVANCIATKGSRPLTMEWYEGDNLLAEDSGRTTTEVEEEGALIDSVLPLVTIPNWEKDNGRTATCVVTDALGNTIRKDVTLQVTEPTTTVPTTTMQAYPQIIEFPSLSPISLVIGSRRVLECIATGVPEPEVTWYRDDTKLKSNSGESRVKVVVSQYSQSGIYRCEAKNFEGSTQRQLTIDVQGPPVIPDAEKLPNKTEQITLKSGQEYVRLSCQSDAFPRPEIEWVVEDMELSKLDASNDMEMTEGRSASNLSINVQHFTGSKSGTRVICTANNAHGAASKFFVITVPIAGSSIGMIIGIVIALLVLFVLIGVVVFLALAKRRKGTMTTTSSPESGGVCGGFSTCCQGSKVVKSKELKEEDDAVAVEHVKEVNEAGTNEEKQKLTDAEEKPANADAQKSEEQEAQPEGEEKKEEKVKKTKNKIQLPLQCCKGKKTNDLENVSQEEHVEEAEDQKAENCDAKKDDVTGDDKKERRENDQDSGKGDTLEKVIEEEETAAK